MWWSNLSEFRKTEKGNERILKWNKEQNNWHFDILYKRENLNFKVAYHLRF